MILNYKKIKLKKKGSKEGREELFLRIRPLHKG
jgi:hypothetical protein